MWWSSFFLHSSPNRNKVNKWIHIWCGFNVVPISSLKLIWSKCKFQAIPSHSKPIFYLFTYYFRFYNFTYATIYSFIASLIGAFDRRKKLIIIFCIHFRCCYLFLSTLRWLEMRWILMCDDLLLLLCFLLVCSCFFSVFLWFYDSINIRRCVCATF